MDNTTNIPTSLYIPSQLPLDRKLWTINEASISSLGVSDNLAYTYYKGLVVYCSEEDSYWKWRPKEGEEIGLILEDFTYPDPWIKDGVDYSNITYNFFTYSSGGDQDNFVRNLIINIIDLPESFNKQDICNYILSLPAINRTIKDTDSKWNIIIGQQEEDLIIPKFIYEIQNKGKGIIEEINGNNLLLITDKPKGLQDVLNIDSNLSSPAYIVISESFKISTEVTNGQNIIEIQDNENVDDINSPAIRIGKSIQNSGTIMSFEILATKMIIRDGLNNKGLEYAGSYDANFTANSLITKQFAEDLLENGSSDYYYWEGSVLLSSSGIPRISIIREVRSNLPFLSTPTIIVTGNFFKLDISGLLVSSSADVTGSVTIGHNPNDGSFQTCSGLFSATGVDTRAFTGSGSPITDSYVINILFKAKKTI